MELHLQRAASQRDNLLDITVVMRAATPEGTSDPDWRARCGQVYCDLRGYLMGHNGEKA